MRYTFVNSQNCTPGRVNCTVCKLYLNKMDSGKALSLFLIVIFRWLAGRWHSINVEWINESLWKFWFSMKSDCTEVKLEKGKCSGSLQVTLLSVRGTRLLHVTPQEEPLRMKPAFRGSLFHLELGHSFRKHPVAKPILQHANVVWRVCMGKAGLDALYPGGIPIVGQLRILKMQMPPRRIEISYVSNLAIVF